MHHILKVDPFFFQLMKEGTKTFELRYDDRDYMPNDTLTLKETKYSCEEMEEGKPLEFTGEELGREVHHVLHSGNGKFGLKLGFVILQL